MQTMQSREGANLGPSPLAGFPGWGLVLLTSLHSVLPVAGGDDWPQFRGPRGDGVSAEAQVPIRWSNESQLAWKVRIPGAGWSQPVIHGRQIFLTTAVSDRPSRPKDYASGTSDPYTTAGGKAAAPEVNIEWKVLAIDLQSGDTEWVRTVLSARPRYPIHPSNTYASETPAADAKGVYAWFGAPGALAAFDLAGQLRWRRDLGVFRQQANLGTGSSPRLEQGLLYLQCFNEEQAFLVCLDTADGHERWRTTRPATGTCWNTPLLWHSRRRPELIVCGQQLMTSHDPLTGREFWRASGVDMPGPASLGADSDCIYFGFKSPVKSTSLYALAAGAEGDQPLANSAKRPACEKWAVPGAAPGMASPVVAEGCVYVVNNAVLSCRDAASGRELFKERLPGFRGVVASPIVAGHRLVVVDESGRAAVLEVGPKFNLAGQSRLDDTFWASPAVAGRTLLLRGVDYLYCIRD
jgi:outer membrane protein assembly factor BamB